jgi:exonuclease III
MDKYNHNILVWNVRGLNARCRRDNIRVVVNDCNISVVCIQETKLAVISDFLISEMLGDRFASLPAVGTSGGILIACRSPDATCLLFHRGMLSVSVLITFEDETEQCCLTGGLWVAA